MDGWNTSFLLGCPGFRGYVSFREGSSQEDNKIPPNFAFQGEVGYLEFPNLNQPTTVISEMGQEDEIRNWSIVKCSFNQKTRKFKFKIKK